jgi:hypothetical protein
MFRFFSCKFRIQKSKEKTARVVLWREFNIMNCFTLEASFHGYFDKERETDIEKPRDFNDICLIDNKLYVLVDSTVYTLDLEGNISLENMKKIFSNLSSIKKIIRTPNNEMVFIGLNNQYEKIN